MILDLGQGMANITNSGSSTSDEANSIKLEFPVAVIDRVPPSFSGGQIIWLAASASYYNEGQAWVGLKQFTLASNKKFNSSEDLVMNKVFLRF